MERIKKFYSRLLKHPVVIIVLFLVLAVVGFLLAGISSHGILSQLGLLLGRGTLLSLGTVFFVLPGLLYLLDGIIKRTTLQCRFKENKKSETTTDTANP